MERKLTIPATVGALLSDPGTVRSAMLLLNGVANMEVTLEPPVAFNSMSPGKPTIRVGGENLTLALPFRFESAIADPTGGGTVDVQCRAQLAALLLALRRAGFNPG